MLLKVHFTGIGGIGMSALARLYLSRGMQISGSDSTPSELLDDLEKEGVKVQIAHQAENVPPDIDLLVYTEAVPADNPERVQARKLGIRELSYFQALGELSRDFRTIAIAGTHGKSTTTVMCGLALPEASTLVGTKVFEWDKSNFHLGDSDLLVVEACEYRDSFLNLKPYIAVITSIEAEHLDYFKNEENYFNSFRKFVAPAQFLVADFSNPQIQKIAQDFSGEKIDSAKLTEKVPTLRAFGAHNVQNASKVLGIFQALGRDLSDAKKSLEKFRGSWRRMEQRAERVYDDYGHHPTEIKATLKALREQYPKHKLYCVFQPHQHSRTKFFLDEFAKSFQDADEVLVPSIYRVRDSEEDVRSVSAEDLVHKIQEQGVKTRFTDGFENTITLLKKEIDENCVLITMGAGPVDQVVDGYLS